MLNRIAKGLPYLYPAIGWTLLDFGVMGLAQAQGLELYARIAGGIVILFTGLILVIAYEVGWAIERIEAS